MRFTSWDVASRGPTPIVHFDLPQLKLFAKLEYLNPTGSIKHRIGRALVEELIESGALTEASPYLVEATAGNTALALQHALHTLEMRRTRVVAVMSDKMSTVKVERLRRHGVIVRIVPYELATDCLRDPPLIRAMCRTSEELPGAVMSSQFWSDANPRAHEFGTGMELVTQLDEPPDAIFMGAGTGGTISGVARALRTAGWPTRVVLADPQGSVIGAAWRGQPARPGRSYVEGIGGDFVPRTLDLSLIDDVASVSDQETRKASTELRASGFPVGTSSACAVAAALRYGQAHSSIRNGLVFFADHGSAYPVDPRGPR